MPMLVMESAELPSLVSVTCFVAAATPTAVEGNVRLEAESLTGVPVPLRAIVCGDPYDESEILTDAVSTPEAAGSKVTVMTQEAADAMVAAQVLVSLNEL